MIRPDLAFPDRIRWAAGILREVTAYYEVGCKPEACRYSAIELEDLAAECEAKLRYDEAERDELVHLVQRFSGSGAWTVKRATDLVDAIIHAGYGKVGDR